jgi:hypothetical protein
MLLHATIHGITEQTNNEGEITIYCELLLTDPLQATRFNVTKFNAAQFQKLQALTGKKVLIGLNQRKTSSGTDYWAMTKFPEPFQEQQAAPKAETTAETPQKNNHLFGTKAA